MARTYEPKFKDTPAEEPEVVEKDKAHKAKERERVGKIRNRKKLEEAGSTIAVEGDVIDIWERRILNPDHRESTSIRIKTPGMRLRWINLTQRGRFQRARYEQGWVPVQKTDLVDEREIWGVSYTVEGYVCRGEKQGEMLMKIPEAVYRKIQERRSALNTESYKKLKESMGNAGHKHFKEKYGGSAGDQAAESASKFVGSISFGTEKVSTEEIFE